LSLPWPFVGREPELGRVEAALDHGLGVVLTGDAGVGKTRLLAETVGRLEAGGVRVLTVRATRSSTVLPLGAFGPLLPVGDDAPSLATARQAILSRASTPPTLAIDDAHALDEASAVLTHQLVTQDGVRVVATVRSGEAVPDAIVGLWKDGLCERIDLAPLDRPDVERLVVDALGGPADGRLLHLVWSRTLGNVLFARELLAAAVERGSLVARSGIWTLEGPIAAPPRLRELIADRLRDLGPDERTALDLLALGEPLPFDLLLELVGSDHLESLEDRGLLTVDDTVRAEARLGHPLLADVLLDALGTVKRRRLLQALVELVAARPLPVDAGDRVVRWRIDAGLDVSPDELVRVARRYILVDAALAEVLARRALDGGGGAGATITLAEVLVVSGRPEEAALLLDTLPSGSSRDHCRREVDMAYVLSFGLNRSSDAAERLEALLTDVSDEDWGYVASQVPLMWLLAGEIHHAHRAAGVVLDDARASGTDRVNAELVLIPALNLLGTPVSALARAAEVLPRSAGDPSFNPYVVGQIQTAVGTGHRYAGDLDAAEREATRVYEWATREGARLLHGLYALRLGQVALARGALLRAEQLFLEAVTALDGDDMTRACAVDHVRYTRALTGRSDMPAALAPNTLYAVEHAYLSSAVEAAAGDLSYARALALGGARRAIGAGHLAYAVFALYEAARHGAAPAAAELLAGVPAPEGAFLPELIAAIEALADRDDERLEAIAARLERLGYLLHAAELTAAAAGAAAERGRPTKASLLRARAQQLVDRCDGATTELLRSPGGDRLTTREREVAGFAARGLTDVQIAARLSVSRRTVETHLYRVYAKLGVAGRRELEPLFTVPARADASASAPVPAERSGGTNGGQRAHASG
jgi:DNA-binding CsgD family transcriptional regulator